MNQEDKETQALRAELEYRLQPIELNPQILQNVFKKTDLKPDWYVDFFNLWQKLILPVQRFSWQFLEWIWTRRVGMSFATSVLMVVVLIKLLIPYITYEPVPRVKSPPLILPELVVSNPQETAQTLKADLAKLGIVATVKTFDKGWMIEIVNLSTDNLDALSALLTEYKLKLPPPGESGLRILVVPGN